MKIEAFLKKMEVANKGYFQCINTPTGTVAHNNYMIIRTSDNANVPNTKDFSRGTFQCMEKIEREMKRGYKSFDEIPTIEGLKECIRDIAGRKTSTKVAYYFGDNVMVNARWLKDILEYLGEDVAVYYYSSKAPIKIVGDKAVVYICGINCNGARLEEGYCYQVN